MTRPARVLVLAALLAAGCGGGSESPPAAETGAKACVVMFYESLAAKRYADAYDALDAASRKRLTVERLGTLAEGYARQVGFPVESVHVSACEEQGDRATAHLVLAGHSSGHTRRYNEAIVVRKQDGRWGVVLPDNFGRKAR